MCVRVFLFRFVSAAVAAAVSSVLSVGGLNTIESHVTRIGVEM